MSYEVIWGDDIAEIRFFGNFTDSDLLNSNKDIACSSQKEKIKYQLMDITAITSAKVTEAAVRTIAIFNKDVSMKRTNTKMAIVCSHSNLYSPISLYQFFTDKSKSETKVFEDRQEAENWLDIHHNLMLAKAH